MVKITAIVDDSAGRPPLLAEHGFSVLIEKDGFRLLFDTGGGAAFRENARTLGVTFDSLDALALSHGHDDHTGNLTTVLSGGFAGKVYCHPDVVLRRYSRRDNGTYAEIGMGRQAVRQLEGLGGARRIDTPGLTEIAEGLFLTGAVPRQTAYEDVGGRFFLDQQGDRPDTLPDDQSLIIQLGDSVAVVAGCAHSGIVNVLRFVRSRFPRAPVRAVIGGIHLVNAAADRIEKTVAAFKEIAVGRLMLGHCTGKAALAAVERAYGERFALLSPGVRLDL